MEAPPRLTSQNYVDDAWHSGSKGTVEGQQALCLGVAASSSPLNRAVPERKEKEKSKSKEEESKSKEKEKEKSKSKEEEEKNKSKEKAKSKKPWTSRLVLGAAVVGVVVVVVAGVFIVLSAIGGGGSVDQEEDEDDAPMTTMKAPGSGGQIICRDRFEEDPKNYFSTLRLKGSKAAVDAFQ